MTTEPVPQDAAQSLSCTAKAASATRRRATATGAAAAMTGVSGVPIGKRANWRAMSLGIRREAARRRGRLFDHCGKLLRHAVHRRDAFDDARLRRAGLANQPHALLHLIA